MAGHGLRNPLPGPCRGAAAVGLCEDSRGCRCAPVRPVHRPVHLYALPGRQERGEGRGRLTRQAGVGAGGIPQVPRRPCRAVDSGDRAGGEARHAQCLVRAVPGQQHARAQRRGPFGNRRVQLGQRVQPGPQRRPQGHHACTAVDHLHLNRQGQITHQAAYHSHAGAAPVVGEVHRERDHPAVLGYLAGMDQGGQGVQAARDGHPNRVRLTGQVPYRVGEHGGQAARVGHRLDRPARQPFHAVPHAPRVELPQERGRGQQEPHRTQIDPRDGAGQNQRIIRRPSVPAPEGSLYRRDQR